MTINGCHNRAPFLPTVQVQSGWIDDGRRVIREEPFRMAVDCQYRHTDLGQADAGCNGCRWRDGE